MLSRVAERVFWLARYLERIEHTARLINVHTALLLDLPEHKNMNWFTLVNIFDAKEAYFERHDSVNENDVMHFLLIDNTNPLSLLNAIFSLRENARTTIDVLPEVIWEHINELHIEVKGEMSAFANRRRRQQLLLTITERCQTVWGIISNHMSRNFSYDFLQAGKYLERADMSSRILEMTSVLVADRNSEAVKEYEGILWSTMLRTLNARQMYIQTDDSELKSRYVLAFLVGDEAFPGSVTFCLSALGRALSYLPKSEEVLKLQKKIIASLKSDEGYSINTIQSTMDQLQLSMNALNGMITSTWFHPDYSVE